MKPPLEAAQRLRQHLEEAKIGGYYKDAWYAYMARWDVEACIDFVLNQEERDGRAEHVSADSARD